MASPHSLVDVKLSIVHPGGPMAHCSKCSSEQISPHSHTSRPSRYPRFIMFALVLATPAHNLFTVFYTAHGCFPPGGRCSADGAGMFVSCSFSLHFCSPSWSDGGLGWRLKWRQNFIGIQVSSEVPSSLWSMVCFIIFMRVATRHRILGGAIAANG